MSELQEIPASAWQDVGDPKRDQHKQCFSCGGTNVRDLSMDEMMMLPKERIVDAHTFMIPNLAWGYLQCDDCEAAQLESTAKRSPWWIRLFRRKQ
jgi:hypothetical protein